MHEVARLVPLAGDEGGQARRAEGRLRRIEELKERRAAEDVEIVGEEVPVGQERVAFRRKLRPFAVEAVEPALVEPLGGERALLGRMDLRVRDDERDEGDDEQADAVPGRGGKAAPHDGADAGDPAERHEEAEPADEARAPFERGRLDQACLLACFVGRARIHAIGVTTIRARRSRKNGRIVCATTRRRRVESYGA